MAKKKDQTLDQALDEEVKAITSKWKTLDDVQQTLLEHFQLLAKGKISLELSSEISREAAKVNKRMKEQIKEMQKIAKVNRTSE